jgi:hypothetical protein
MATGQFIERDNILQRAFPHGGIDGLNASGQAVIKVVFHQPPIDLAERALHGEHLPKDLLAIGIGFNHPGDGAQMALRATQTAHEVGPEVERVMLPGGHRRRSRPD